MNALLSMKKLRDARKRVPFFSSLDLFAITDDGIMIGVSGRAGAGFRLRGVDYLLWDESGQNAFFQNLCKFLSQIPEGFVLNFLRRSSEKDPELISSYEALIPKEDPLSKAILEEKTKAFREKRLLKKELFLFVSFMPEGEKKKFRKNFFSKELDQKTSKILLNVQDLIQRSFRELGIKCEKLSKKEILEEYYQKLNPSLSQIIPYGAISKEEVTWPRFETLRSKLLLNVPEIEKDYFYLDGFYHGVVNLRLLPEEAHPGMSKIFENFLPEDSEILFTIRKPDQEKEISRMKIRSNFSKANVFFRIMEDTFAEEKRRQFESFLTEMAEEGEQVFQISLSVLVKAKTARELTEKKEAVLKAFPKLGRALGVYDHFEHDLLFVSHLPLQGEDNPLSFSVLNGSLTRLLPLCEEWKGTESPEILIKTYRDEGLKLDLFDPELPAKHALMIGSTGSGKSFTTNFLLSQFLMASPKNHVVIIDIGGSYRKLARIFKGSYLDIDCSEEYAINLFPEKVRFIPKEGEVDSDLLAFLTTLLEKMVTEDKKITPSDLRILEKAILKVYEPPSHDQAPLLQNVEGVLRNFSLGDEEDRCRAYHFSKNLSIWTEGRFGKILNRPGKLSLDDRLIVFDLAKLAQHPELQSILFFVIRSALSRKLADTSLRKMIVIDEGWRHFDDEIGSRLIEELYRTLRKLNGLVLSISQSPEDYLKSKVSTAILANSYVKYILKLQKGHELLSKLDLGENEIKAVRELETRPGLFSEIYIKFLNQGVIAKLEPSGLDYWIATTDPDDFSLEEKIRKEYPQYSDLEILQVLKEKYPHGARHALEASGKELSHASRS